MAYRLATLTAVALCGATGVLVAANRVAAAKSLAEVTYLELLSGIILGLTMVLVKARDRKSKPSPRDREHRGLPFWFVFLLGGTRIIVGAIHLDRLLDRLARWTVLVLAPDGHSLLLRPLSDDPIVVNEVLNWRSYESFLKIREGEVVLDIGAHIGVFTIHASSAVGPSGRVVAVEPETENFNFLAKNCRRSGLGNVYLRNSAAGATAGTQRLRVYKHGRTTTHALDNSSAPKALAGTDFVAVDTNVVTIDSLVKDFRLRQVNAVKIDVEDGEISVLEGATEVLKVFQPRVVIEVAQPKQRSIVDWFTGHDYQATRDPNFPWILFAWSSNLRQTSET